MRKNEQEAWLDGILDEVLAALTEHEELVGALVFRGARVLKTHIEMPRRTSLDLDCCVTDSFAGNFSTINEKQDFLERTIREGLSRRFRSQQPVRLAVESVVLKAKPPSGHPLGWDGFTASVRVSDARHPGVRGLPAIKVDIAAAEELSPASVCLRTSGNTDYRVYSLERFAGEKMRAFLESMPAHVRKLNKTRRPRRVKDLFDVAVILSEHPLTDEDFWRTSAGEFRISCRSRLVDCEGPVAFLQDWETTQSLLEHSDLPTEPDPQSIYDAIEAVTRFWSTIDLFPLSSPLPQGDL